MEGLSACGWKTMYCLAVFVAMVNVAASEKILMLSPSVGSHLMQMNSVAEGLLARGHVVHAIFHSRAKVAKGILNPKVKVIEYDTGVEPIFQIREYQENLLASELADFGFFDKMKSLNILFEMLTNECRTEVRHLTQRVFKKLQAEHFDFVVLDGLMKCYSLIAYELGVPFGNFMAFLPPDIPHVALQSPVLLRGPIDDIIMDSNTPPLLAKVTKVFFVATMFNSMDVFGDISNVSLFELQKQTKLWLYDVSKVLDTPMPVSPNVINVGGLNVRKPKPLPEGKLQQFVDSASDGFILVSFGSFAKFFPDKIIRVLLDTFKDLPYKIVWKWDKKSLKADQVVPPNVLAVNWMPQNDVLGHKNIKLFVTHCGNSGQHEALYNSVPMVGIPLFGDQIFNAKRIEGRFGRHIRARDLSEDKLLNLITHVIRDRKYSDNIRKASAIFRDQPMEPRETAAYWIDHVIKYGADHLLSKTNEMSWIQILMWDVLFVVCFVVFMVLSTLFLLCRCLFRRCCRGKSSTPKVKQS
jgi:glucuronosyltransferase